jgi:hypothetical protein
MVTRLYVPEPGHTATVPNVVREGQATWEQPEVPDTGVEVAANVSILTH